MSWIQPLSEDFLFCDPQEITTELYRVCPDEQSSSVDEQTDECSGSQEEQL